MTVVIFWDECRAPAKFTSLLMTRAVSSTGVITHRLYRTSCWARLFWDQSHSVDEENQSTFLRMIQAEGCHLWFKSVSRGCTNCCHKTTLRSMMVQRGPPNYRFLVEWLFLVLQNEKYVTVALGGRTCDPTVRRLGRLIWKCRAPHFLNT